MRQDIADHLATQLVETREEISRADSKASTLLAGAGVAVGAIVAGLIAGDISIGSMPLLVVVLSAAAAVAVVAGLTAIGAAIWPHCGKPEPGRARYFAEAAAHDTLGELREAIERDLQEGDRLLHQVHGLSRRVLAKYTHLRRGMALLASGIALACGAGLLALVIK